MARPLLTSPIHNLLFSSTPFTLFFALLALFSVFSVTTFLCASDKLKKKLRMETEKATSTKSKEHKFVSKLNSKLGNRALSMVKMLSWRKVEAEEEEAHGGVGDYSDQDQEALWRKNILMGEKCRPFNFSGKIENDFQGKETSMVRS